MNFFSSDFNHEWSWKFFRTGLISNIFQIKYNEWVSNFWIFENQKLSKMTSNVNGTSIMIHMRLTACRLDTCATSGRCYVRFYSFTNFIKQLFIQVYDCTDWVWTTCEYEGGGVRCWTTSGIEIFVNWLTGTF